MSAADLISKRTRNAFREELVGWTLAEITTEFDNEGFSPDHTHDPQVSGQRRSLVEQLVRPRGKGRMFLAEVCQDGLASSFDHLFGRADR